MMPFDFKPCFVSENKELIGKRGASFVLLAIIILGAALRIYNLGAESLWYDEVSSMDQALRDLPSLFSGFHLSPFYFLILRYWLRIAGVSEFALRIPSVILGVSAIFLIYKLSAALFNKKTGLFSSFILAISPFHIFYSQEVRHYTLFVFLTLISIIFFLRIIEDKYSSIGIYVYYGVATTLLLYTTLWGIFLIGIQNLFCLRRVFFKKRWLITQIIIFLIFLLWVVPFFMFISDNGEYVKACLDWIERPDVNSLIETFRTFSFGGSRYGGWDFLFSPEEIGFSQILLYIFGVFFVLGVSSSCAGNNWKVSFINLWLFIPILVLFLFSFLFSPLFVIRYLIFVSPAYYILVAKGIERARKPLFQVGMMLIVAALTLPTLTTYYTKELKVNWKEAINYLESRIDKDEIVVVAPSHTSQMFSYYSKDGVKFQDKNNRRITFINDLGIGMLKGGFIYKRKRDMLIGVHNLAQFEELVSSNAIIAKNNGVWLILVVKWLDDYPEFIKYFEDHYKKDDKYHFCGEGIRVYHYRSEIPV